MNDWCYRYKCRQCGRVLKYSGYYDSFLGIGFSKLCSGCGADIGYDAEKRRDYDKRILDIAKGQWVRTKEFKLFKPSTWFFCYKFETGEEASDGLKGVR